MGTDFNWLSDSHRIKKMIRILEFYSSDENIKDENIKDQDKDCFGTIIIDNSILRHYVIYTIVEESDYDFQGQDIEEYTEYLIDIGCIEELSLVLITSYGCEDMKPTKKQGYGKLTNKGKLYLKLLKNAD